MSETLKPCPSVICGKANVRLNDTGHYHYVSCIECEAEGPWNEDRSEAIAAWNRRPESGERIEGWVEELGDEDGHYDFKCEVVSTFGRTPAVLLLPVAKPLPVVLPETGGGE